MGINEEKSNFLMQIFTLAEELEPKHATIILFIKLHLANVHFAPLCTYSYQRVCDHKTTFIYVMLHNVGF